MNDLTKDNQGIPAMFGFDAKENVKTIPAHMLEQSIRVEGRHGKPLATRPIQSWTALALMITLLDAAKVNYSMDSISAGYGIFQSFKNNNTGSLSHNKAVCILIKG